MLPVLLFIKLITKMDNNGTFVNSLSELLSRIAKNRPNKDEQPAEALDYLKGQSDKNPHAVKARPFVKLNRSNILSAHFFGEEESSNLLEMLFFAENRLAELRELLWHGIQNDTLTEERYKTIKEWAECIQDAVNGKDNFSSLYARDGLDASMTVLVESLKADVVNLNQELRQAQVAIFNYHQEQQMARIAVVANHAAAERQTEMIRTLIRRSDLYAVALEDLTDEYIPHFLRNDPEKTRELALMSLSEIRDLDGVGQKSLDNIRRAFLKADLPALCNLNAGFNYGAKAYQQNGDYIPEQKDVNDPEFEWRLPSAFYGHDRFLMLKQSHYERPYTSYEESEKYIPIVGGGEKDYPGRRYYMPDDLPLSKLPSLLTMTETSSADKEELAERLRALIEKVEAAENTSGDDFLDDIDEDIDEEWEAFLEEDEESNLEGHSSDAYDDFVENILRTDKGE